MTLFINFFLTLSDSTLCAFDAVNAVQHLHVRRLIDTFNILHLDLNGQKLRGVWGYFLKAFLCIY